MRRNRIIGFGSADGIGSLGQCPEGYTEDNGNCIEVVGPQCPDGTFLVNRGTSSDPLWQCEGTGTREVNGSVSSSQSAASSYSKAGSAGLIGAVVILGIVGLVVYSAIGK
jgi:hypothetical protein